MRFTSAAVLSITTLLGVLDAAEKGKQPAAPAANAPAAAVSPRQAALDRLLSERESPATLQTAIDQARKLGVGEQVILEARFLFHVDRNDDDAIAALLPEFAMRREAFKLDDSQTFATAEDWLAACEYVEAIAALKKGDKDAFKKHITEAFWLSPRQGSAFAPHIERLRLEQAMNSIKIDFTTEFTTINSDETKSLKKFLGDDNALLLHFWSPWSDESEAGMSDFMITAKELIAKKIAVVSILPENSSKALDDALASLKTHGKNPPGAWIADKTNHSISRLLRVQTLPTMVLVASDGRILFNGHPAEDELWIALKKINREIRRPVAADDSNKP